MESSFHIQFYDMNVFPIKYSLLNYEWSYKIMEAFTGCGVFDNKSSKQNNNMK